MLAALITPPEVLYRVVRHGRSLEWPPATKPARGRFDDPRQPPKYRVLYAGERRACLYEKLAPFRTVFPGAAEPLPIELIQDYRIIEFAIDAQETSDAWLDLRSPATYALLRSELPLDLAGTIEPVEPATFDVDVAVITGTNRLVTQVIGSWAHRNGYQGVCYPTRHAPDLSCWAIFDGVGLIVHSEYELNREDPDLIAVANSWGIDL